MLVNCAAQSEAVARHTEAVARHLGRYRALFHGDVDADDLTARDPAFIRQELPFLATIAERWFHSQVEGLDRIPEGQFLAVGNHSGGILGFDVGIFLVAFYRRSGAERPLHIVGHDMVVSWPPFPRPVVRYMRKFGTVRASRRNVDALFRAGSSVLVYPGGDTDAMRPWRLRNKVVFSGRRGFIRSALRAGVPVVPVVTHGAHDALCILSDGRSLAHMLGLDRRFRIKALPIGFGLPWGFFCPFLPYVPLPVKVRVRVLDPINLGLPPAAAEDAAAVDAGYRLVERAMQRALDDMAGEARGHRRAGREAGRHRAVGATPAPERPRSRSPGGGCQPGWMASGPVPRPHPATLR